METVFGQTLALQLGNGDEHCALESDTTRQIVKGTFTYLNTGTAHMFMALIVFPPFNFDFKIFCGILICFN